MEYFVIISVILLFVLAIFDLVVGVSNDAVNFLNSAIGSKVAPVKIILTVASVGLLLGSISSAGMMEIARKGVFYPEYFNLFDVLVIFLAVMIADIILLDIFNTLGLPTSTTVSIIFELLGAAFIISVMKIVQSNEPLNYLFGINSGTENIKNYLNWSKTSTIISGIFLSVIIAFVVGYLVMYLSRLSLGYLTNKKNKTVYYTWCAVALLSISYFLVFKSLKSTYSSQTFTINELVKLGYQADEINFENKEILLEVSSGFKVSFKSKMIESNHKKEIVYQAFFGNKKIKEISDFLKQNLGIIMLGMIVFWMFFVFILERFKINSLKFIVLFGTFSLALAFAGNDLVNFIGVSLAGFQSFTLYNLANVNGNLSIYDFQMNGLNMPIQSSQLYLVVGGIIMIVVLWMSKKAKNVTETEVNLSHQDETEEKFKSTRVSRGIVRFFVHNSKIAQKILPQKLIVFIKSRFRNDVSHFVEQDKPAFDLIRASVNLTIASLLIVLATDLKLPLSTTYVSFMVAMGSSLADKAWGRESASYRIAGVLNVILGWLVTALIAFLLALLVAVIIYKFKIWGLITILTLMFIVIFKTSTHHQKKLKKKDKLLKLRTQFKIDDSEINHVTNNLNESLLKINAVFDYAIQSIIYLSESNIKKAIINFEDINSIYADTKNHLFKQLKYSQKEQILSSKTYILTNDLMQDMLRSLNNILNNIQSHIKNAHSPIKQKQANFLIEIQKDFKNYINKVTKDLENNIFETEPYNIEIKKQLFEKIEASLNNQIIGINKNEYGFKNSDLMVSILMETKDIIAVIDRFPTLFLRIKEGKNPFLSI